MMGGTFLGEYRQCTKNYAPDSLKMQMQLIVATPKIMAIAEAKDHQVINGHLTDRISRLWIGP